jgi:hypothetical protein
MSNVTDYPDESRKRWPSASTSPLVSTPWGQPPVRPQGLGVPVPLPPPRPAGLGLPQAQAPQAAGGGGFWDFLKGLFGGGQPGMPPQGQGMGMTPMITQRDSLDGSSRG